ncbi:hypothetical protein [Polaribacter irgensii]|nr:hypothetical protein [Polaribacter irgensii]
MEKITYQIDHSNNNLKIYDFKNILKYSSSWFLDFGKTTSEIYNIENHVVYTIIKKFKFWKWRTVYNITNTDKEILALVGSNIENSLFALKTINNRYEVKIHYGQKKSFFKNGIKIAEINDAFETSKEENTSNLLLSNSNELKIIFLLITCLKTGEINRKSMIKSQKKLIPLEEDWNS